MNKGKCNKCKLEKELFQFNLCYKCISEIKKIYPDFKYMLNREYGLFANIKTETVKESILKNLKKTILKSQINNLINKLHCCRIEKSYENKPLERLLYLAWSDLDKK